MRRKTAASPCRCPRIGPDSQFTTHLTHNIRRRRLPLRFTAKFHQLCIVHNNIYNSDVHATNEPRLNFDAPSSSGH